jgi:hypothetical protein
MLSIALLLALALAFCSYQTAARELYEGQYAQVDPSTRQWFKDQKVPGTQRLCCSEADGTSAEEDIRQGHYWVRFTATQYNEGAPPTEVDSGWMQVPDETVIHNAGNPNGAAIVWWGWQDRLFIRCFVPGAKV